jgi:hypothetical protein
MGAWALDCFDYDPDVLVTIVDLPDQTAVALENIKQKNAEDRIDTYAMDILDPQQCLPTGADAIWMSQFLDCFSEPQIFAILTQAASILDEDSSLFILELFWDCQKFDVGAYSINATSLYFTCLANGVSRMYRSVDIVGIAQRAGFCVHARHDGLGIGHTLLHLKKSR